MSKIFVFSVFVLNVTYANALIKPNLRNIITNNAIISTLFKEVNKELLDETGIITDLNYMDNPNITEKNIENSLLGVSFYSLLFVIGLLYENKNYSNENKLQKIQMYKTYTKNTRTLLLILILVFNRHVQNAI